MKMRATSRPSSTSTGAPRLPARPMDGGHCHRARDRGAGGRPRASRERVSMPTPTKGARMGGSPAHQKHMLANLATSLFEHGKITTTEARARRLRPYAEKLITFAKRGDMHARRQVLTVSRVGQGHRAQPVRRDRPGHGGPSRWLHPDHEDRSPQGRRRPDGRDRAGQGRGWHEQAASPHPPPGRSGRARRRSPRQRSRRGRRRRGDRGRPGGRSRCGGPRRGPEAADQKAAIEAEAAADAETAADLAGAHGAEDLDETRTTPRRGRAGGVTPLGRVADGTGSSLLVSCPLSSVSGVTRVSVTGLWLGDRRGSATR